MDLFARTKLPLICPACRHQLSVSCSDLEAEKIVVCPECGRGLELSLGDTGGLGRLRAALSQLAIQVERAAAQARQTPEEFARKVGLDDLIARTLRESGLSLKAEGFRDNGIPRVQPAFDVVVRYRQFDHLEAPKLMTVLAVGSHRGEPGGSQFVHAFCHEAREERTLLLNRILAAHDPLTGETDDSPQAWLLRRAGCQEATPEPERVTMRLRFPVPARIGFSGRRRGFREIEGHIVALRLHGAEVITIDITYDFDPLAGEAGDRTLGIREPARGGLIATIIPSGMTAPVADNRRFLREVLFHTHQEKWLQSTVAS